MDEYDFLVEQLKVQGLDDDSCKKIAQITDLKEKVQAVLKTVHDPEIPVNIWDLGLVYRMDVSEENEDIVVDMTLTAPACPIADAIPAEVKERLENLIKDDERGKVTVNLVWDPPWNQDMMSDEAKLILQMF